MSLFEPLEGRRLFTALVHQELHRPPTAMADMNGDGLLDLIVATAESRRGGAGGLLGFNVLLNDGKGALRSSGHTYFDDTDSDSVLTDIAAGDVNGDGVPDVALKLFSVTGQPTPVGRSKTTEAKVVLFVSGDPDSDQDGLDDYTQRKTHILPHVLDTDGNRRTWVIPHVLERNGIAIGDVDGDGGADLVSWVGDDVLILHHGDPHAMTSEDGVLSPGAARGNVRIVGLGDLNGDGAMELIAYDEQAPTILVASWDPKGKQLTLQPTIDASAAAPNGRIDALLIGNMDRDRDDDLVVVSGDRLTVGTNNTKADPKSGEVVYSFSWGAHQMGHRVAAGDVRLGDLDGDGVDDLFGLSAKGHRYIGTVTIVK
jgi:hypothetical protein